MRVLVCGSRVWDKPLLLRAFLSGLLIDFSDMIIIEGEATGADRQAREWAEDHSVPVLPFPADWSLGKAAGHIRNKQMLVDGKPDLVLAFSHNLSESRGTANMVMQAREAGVKTYVIEGP